jgi:ABC-type antimicrobial peptide transport system permease subunit
MAGAVILVLAVAGIHAMTAVVVQQRLRECAVRAALGASPAAIVRYGAGIALRPAGIGIATGCALSFLVVRGLGAVLLGVGGLDPVALIGAALAVSVALGAGVSKSLLWIWRLDVTSILKRS